MQKPIVSFMGPLGCGKGTQAKLIIDKLGYYTISISKLFKEEINSNSELGMELKKFIDTGDWVINELFEKVLISRGTLQLQGLNVNNGLILDGFPINLDQFDLVDKWLENNNLSLTKVIMFELDDDKARERIAHRMVVDGLVSRNDDANEAMITNKLRMYRLSEMEIQSRIDVRGIGVIIDASGGIDEVNEKIVEVLNKL